MEFDDECGGLSVVFGLVDMTVKVCHDAGKGAHEFVRDTCIRDTAALLLGHLDILGDVTVDDEEHPFAVGVKVLHLSHQMTAVAGLEEVG